MLQINDVVYFLGSYGIYSKWNVVRLSPKMAFLKGIHNESHRIVQPELQLNRESLRCIGRHPHENNSGGFVMADALKDQLWESQQALIEIKAARLEKLPYINLIQIRDIIRTAAIESKN